MLGGDAVDLCRGSFLVDSLVNLLHVARGLISFSFFFSFCEFCAQLFQYLFRHHFDFFLHLPVIYFSVAF